MHRAICVSLEGLFSFWPRRSVDSWVGPLFFFFSPLFFFFSEKGVIVFLIFILYSGALLDYRDNIILRTKTGFLPHVLESQWHPLDLLRLLFSVDIPKIVFVGMHTEILATPNIITFLEQRSGDVHGERSNPNTLTTPTNPYSQTSA